MCGIIGVLNRTASDRVTETGLRRMLGAIQHRGPDQFGIYLDEQVGLGSARLSILDVLGGQQPIPNETGDYWIVFNGEIYNFVELRSRLEAHGHQFSTQTDTEVILHLFEEQGPSCLSSLNGQFAVAIWDQRKKRLFLARDRVGIRPLFYTQVGGAFLFASEVKALLADPRVHGEIDPVSLNQIFSYWSTLSPRTVFKDILEVPPGHYAIVDQERFEIHRYYQLSFPLARNQASIFQFQSEQDADWPSREDYLDAFRGLLINATNIRLRADVPVGAYLSGGIDSSTIAAIIRKFSGSHLDTFSIAFNDSEFDESEHQRRMAAWLGTHHHVIQASHRDISEAFPNVIWHIETPILRTSPAPLFLLSRLVHDHGYKVVLTGEGADEILAGYNIFKEAKVRRFWARFPDSTLRPLLFKRLYPYITELQRSGIGYLSAFFRKGLEDVDENTYSHAIRWSNNQRCARFFSDEFHDMATAADASREPELDFPPGFSEWHPLRQAQYLEITIFMSQYLLSSQGDRVAMAHSVEGRFPFLDHRVIEFCNHLPPEMKLFGLTEKRLLKILAREWLPEDIWRRPKRPYRAPIHHAFFHNDAPDYVKELLSPLQLRSAGIFDVDRVASLVKKAQANRQLSETDDMALAGILSTQLVHELFVSKPRSSPELLERKAIRVCTPEKAH
jgi:asparagine synthase (glutamine-hydrolysing)